MWQRSPAEPRRLVAWTGGYSTLGLHTFWENFKGGWDHNDNVQDCASPFCLHVDSMKSAMVGVLSTTEMGKHFKPRYSSVETGVPEAFLVAAHEWAAGPDSLPGAGIHCFPGLALDKYGCTLSGSRLTSQTPTSARARWVQTRGREGGRAAAVCLSLTSSGPCLAVLQESPSPPCIPDSAFSSASVKTGRSCQACSILPAQWELKGALKQSPVPPCCPLRPPESAGFSVLSMPPH